MPEGEATPNWPSAFAFKLLDFGSKRDGSGFSKIDGKMRYPGKGLEVEQLIAGGFDT